MKELLAKAVAEKLRSGDCIGIGSGTTTELAIKAIGERIRSEKHEISGVPTSLRSAQVAAEHGIVVRDLRVATAIDWAFDGADEVDPQGNLLKGRGAAMLREKIVAARSRKLFILVTEDKLVSRLGEKQPLPVEVLPEAALLFEDRARALKALECTRRMAANKYGEVVSEQGNLVYDLRFERLDKEIDAALKRIPGVLETGLFYDFNPEILVADAGGNLRVLNS